MNFYKLSRLLKESGYDSQVIPGGTTVSQQPMQHPHQAQPQQPTQQQPAQQQSVGAEAKDVNHLLQKVSTKLGNNVNKYQHLVNSLKSKPELLDLFAQALEDVGGMHDTTYQNLN